MINAQPFFKKITSKKLAQVNFGGNGRYLFSVNRRAQTMSVFDLATHTVAATITLSASQTMGGCAYRPINQCVYAFGISKIDIIDADPASGTFLTILSSVTIPTPISAYCSVMYDARNDLFFADSYIFDGKTLVESLSSVGAAAGPMYYHGDQLYMVTGVSKEQFNILDSSNPKRVKVKGIFKNVFGASFQTQKIGNFWYTVRSGLLLKLSDIPYLDLVAQVTLSSNLFRGDTAYDPVSKRLMVGGSLNTPMNVVDIAGLTNIGNVTRTSPDTNEAGTADVLYSPYTGYVYAKGANTAGVATGCARVHYYDTSLSLVTMYKGFMAGGEEAIITNTYNTTTMTLNRLRTYQTQ